MKNLQFKEFYAKIYAKIYTKYSFQKFCIDCERDNFEKNVIFSLKNDRTHAQSELWNVIQLYERIFSLLRFYNIKLQ